MGRTLYKKVVEEDDMEVGIGVVRFHGPYVLKVAGGRFPAMKYPSWVEKHKIISFQIYKMTLINSGLSFKFKNDHTSVFILDHERI